MEYSAEEIEHLISCEKTVIESPKTKNTYNYQRVDFKVKSHNTEENFSVFTRINLDFRENFSIGLLFYSSEGKKFFLSE